MQRMLGKLRIISSLSIRYPWAIFFITVIITIWSIYEMNTKMHFEADMTKFLPKDLKAVKSDDYSKKNFNYKYAMLIGVESQNGDLLQPSILRAMEKIVIELKDLKATKTFDSLLTGKKETLVQSVGIDSDNISAMVNLEDAILDKETGSVISGSVIKKLKKDYRIVSPPGKEELLPESDDDLMKIIPDLEKRILGDRSFRDNILSADKRAATIRVQLVRQWDYKKRYAILELCTALNEAKLKARFQGKDSTFPFKIYGKTFDKLTVDDSYIKKRSARIKKKLGPHLEDFLEVTFDEEPQLKELFNKEMTEATFLSVMSYVERRDFFMHPKIERWSNFISHVYEFMLDEIDPFSRDNLEFQLHDVKMIADMGEVYYLVQNVLEKHKPAGVEMYVAGNPVIIGIVNNMMAKDMGILIPVTILVILFMLGISFRSSRGVLIPTITVVLSVIWTMGVITMLGYSVNISTSILPIILLAVGTAYAIHFLNRYYEDISFSTHRREVLQLTVTNIGVAIFMAAVTTMAGFISLASSTMVTTQQFGIFSALGIGFALLLTLTLTPAMLTLWRIPKKAVFKNKDALDEQKGFLIVILRSWGKVVIRHPRAVLSMLMLIFIVCGVMATQNRFEGSMINMFKKDNAIYLSDRFLNKNLGGTTNINLIVRFRDQINLDNPKVQSDFKQRINDFGRAWNRMLTEQPSLRPAVSLKITEKLRKSATGLPASLSEVTSQISLIRDILDEEFIIEDVVDKPVESGSIDESSEKLSSDDMDSLSDDSETDEFDELGGGEVEESDETDSESDLSKEQILALENIGRRLGVPENNWRENGELVMKLRQGKNSPVGLDMIHQFNLLTDFLAVDIKQPEVLHKLDSFYYFLKQLKEPEVVIEDKLFKPTGMVVTPVDFVRRFYKVFYHNDNPEYDRLPDVEKDGFQDKTLTNRSIIGVVLNQALSANRDRFEASITSDLKEFQVIIMLRDGSHHVIKQYLDSLIEKLNTIFPNDDPYIESIKIGGTAPTGLEINNLISSSQVQTIFLSFGMVFMVTFFIFRSAVGGLFSLIPLIFTIVLNFGLLFLLGGEIDSVVMMVSSIAVGIGVDYTIHFMQRLKIQLRAGEDLETAYLHTVTTSGRAVVINAGAVACGFLVLIFSRFVPNTMMGILMAATMLFSTIGALILLPALILIIRPKFLKKVDA